MNGGEQTQSTCRLPPKHTPRFTPYTNSGERLTVRKGELRPCQAERTIKSTEQQSGVSCVEQVQSSPLNPLIPPVLVNCAHKAPEPSAPSAWKLNLRADNRLTSSTDPHHPFARSSGVEVGGWGRGTLARTSPFR